MKSFTTPAINVLQSTNGVFIGDRKIDKSPLSGSIRIRLGLSGPRLLFELERVAQPETPAAPSHTIKDYIQHYFSEKTEKKVGRYTLMVSRAYAEFRKKQRWVYISIISIFAVLFILTGGFAVYKQRQLRLQRKLAAGISYNMKSLEIDSVHTPKSKR